MIKLFFKDSMQYHLALEYSMQFGDIDWMLGFYYDAISIP